MNAFHRIDRALSHLGGEWLWTVGLSIWLINAIASTTLPWLFAPSSVGKVARYLSLAIVVAWYLIKNKAHPAVLPLYLAVAAVLFLLTGSRRIVKYSVIIVMPLADLLGGNWHHGQLRSCVSIGVAFILMFIAANAESPSLMDLCVLLESSRRVPFRRTATTALLVTAAMVSLVFLCCASGIIGDYAMGDGGRFRYFMGFTYALHPAQYLFLITSLACYLSGAKTNPVEMAGLLLANVIVYRLTDSKLAFLCALAVLLVTVLVRLVHRNVLDLRWTWQIAVAIVLVCALASILLAVSYDASITWMAGLNRILEGRLSLGHSALEHIGVRFLGQHVELVGNGLIALSEANPTDAYNYVDSLYLQLLVRYGPVFLGLYVGCYAWVVYHSCKSRDVVLVAILLIVAVQGIIDDAAIHLQYNTFLMLVGMLPQETLVLKRYNDE